MRIIGLTGGIATGKSTVSKMLRELGAPVVDADEISHALTKKGGKAIPQIIAAFGESMLDENGELNRRKLGAAIFSDEKKRLQLNGIIHPLVQEEMQRQLHAYRIQGYEAAVIDVPLLFESNMQNMADTSWLVHCPGDIQLQRLMNRDGYTRKEALQRIQSQMPVDEKTALADVVIDNTGPIEAVQKEVAQLWEKELHAGKQKA